MGRHTAPRRSAKNRTRRTAPRGARRAPAPRRGRPVAAAAAFSLVLGGIAVAAIQPSGDVQLPVRAEAQSAAHLLQHVPAVTVPAGTITLHQGNLTSAPNPKALTGGADPGVGPLSSSELKILNGLELSHPVDHIRLTSPYGWRLNPTASVASLMLHNGQDYGVACGSPVKASADGIVSQAEWAGHSGNRVAIDHGNKAVTTYNHNSELLVHVGDTVKRGETIALAGTTGNSTGCHVHLEVIIDGKASNPAAYLPKVAGQPRGLNDAELATARARIASEQAAAREAALKLEQEAADEKADKAEKAEKAAEESAKAKKQAEDERIAREKAEKAKAAEKSKAAQAEKASAKPKATEPSRPAATVKADPPKTPAGSGEAKASEKPAAEEK